MKWSRKAPLIGERVEIGAHLDLWMRGARFGVIEWQSIKHKPGELLRIKVRMDHPQVRRLVNLAMSDLANIGPKVGKD